MHALLNTRRNLRYVSMLRLSRAVAVKAKNAEMTHVLFATGAQTIALGRSINEVTDIW